MVCDSIYVPSHGPSCPCQSREQAPDAGNTPVEKEPPAKGGSNTRLFFSLSATRLAPQIPRPWTPVHAFLWLLEDTLFGVQITYCSWFSPTRSEDSVDSGHGVRPGDGVGAVGGCKQHAAVSLRLFPNSAGSVRTLLSAPSPPLQLQCLCTCSSHSCYF